MSDLYQKWNEQGILRTKLLSISFLVRAGIPIRDICKKEGITIKEFSSIKGKYKDLAEACDKNNINGLIFCIDIVVGASSTPHALILEQTKGFIKENGYELEIKVFNDYVLPNYALENGELDANYFQHKPYLNDFNEANGTHLVTVKDVHFEPMGVYSGNKNSLESYTNSDKIIVPSDKSNYERAVSLLKEHGMDKANLVEVEAQNIPLMLSDCSYAVINGNYALSAGVVNRCLVE